MLSAQGHLNEILRGERHPAGAAGELKAHAADPFIRPVDDLRADQPIRAGEVEVKVIRFAFVKQAATEGLGDQGLRETRAQDADRIGAAGGRE